MLGSHFNAHTASYIQLTQNLKDKYYQCETTRD